ncbi:hypothetical protein EGI11_11000 [Chryseobacterium sp. H3056]|uniref:Uncharacterized protein n=1 Tax=Kaistella daneshvariae TaxID=2487074 RepID=A0A3N0WT84_9FLAO|nr:hypothetical protein EGI11_11000 [Kaistella daneshvariae]
MLFSKIVFLYSPINLRSHRIFAKNLRLKRKISGGISIFPEFFKFKLHLNRKKSSKDFVFSR